MQDEACSPGQDRPRIDRTPRGGQQLRRPVRRAGVSLRREGAFRATPETGIEAIAVEAGRNIALHQGLGHWTVALRTGSSTHALVEQVRRRSNMLHHVRPARRGLEPLITFCLARAQSIVIYAALQPPCSPFTMGTRRWRPLRAQTRLSGRGGNAECRSERSIPRRAACIATCVDFILIPFSFALNP